MSLVSSITDLAARISAEFKNVRPRMVPVGGSAGQFLKKNSSVDYETSWDTVPTDPVITSGADLFWFGDGSDGDLTLSTGTTSLTRDMFYNNVTLTGTAILNTAGYRLHIAGVLDIENLTGGYVGRFMNPANNATGSNGAAAAAASPGFSVGGGSSGSAGGAGTTTAGVAGSTATSSGNYSGGPSVGGAGAGGAGASGSGAAGATAFSNAITAVTRYRRMVMECLRGTTLVTGGYCGGGGGGGGGGDGTDAGGGGGSGGPGGSVFFLFARTIKRGPNTVPSAIRAMGAAGGNGRSVTAGNCGGGGGGTGGAGGWVQIIYRFLTGATAPACIDVSGGAGGLGGTGVGTGVAGRAGSSGSGGFISKFCLQTALSEYAVGPTHNLGVNQTPGAAAIQTMDL